MKIREITEAKLQLPSEEEWNQSQTKSRQIRLKIYATPSQQEQIIKNIIDNTRIAAKQLGITTPEKIRYGGSTSEWVFITAKTNALRDILIKIANKTQDVSVHSEYQYLKDRGWLNPEPFVTKASVFGRDKAFNTKD